MTLKAISVRLDEETLARVEQMAKMMDRPRAWLMAQAIKQFVDQEEWFLKQVDEGIKAADEGRVQDHASLKRKWEAKRATRLD